MPFSGMACNSWTRESIRLCTFSGWCGRCRIRLERMSQVWSVGLMYGVLASQFITLIPVSSMKVMYTCAVWARALSCIKINATPIAPAYDLAIGSRISLRCHASVIPPLWNTYSSVWPSKGISVQTMMSPHRTVQLRQCYSLRIVLPEVSTP